MSLDQETDRYTMLAAYKTAIRSVESVIAALNTMWLLSDDPGTKQMIDCHNSIEQSIHRHLQYSHDAIMYGEEGLFVGTNEWIFQCLLAHQKANGCDWTIKKVFGREFDYIEVCDYKQPLEDILPSIFDCSGKVPESVILVCYEDDVFVFAGRDSLRDGGDYDKEYFVEHELIADLQ